LNKGQDEVWGFVMGSKRRKWKTGKLERDRIDSRACKRDRGGTRTSVPSLPSSKPRETEGVLNGLLVHIRCQGAGRSKPGKRAAVLVNSPSVAAGMVKIFDNCIRPIHLSRPPSESAKILTIQDYVQGEFTLCSPNLVGQRPEEAVAERWIIAFEEKDNDSTVWVLDILNYLGLKYKD
jgi:hypothetical protein